MDPYAEVKKVKSLALHNHSHLVVVCCTLKDPYPVKLTLRAEFIGTNSNISALLTQVPLVITEPEFMVFIYHLLFTRHGGTKTRRRET